MSGSVAFLLAACAPAATSAQPPESRAATSSVTSGPSTTQRPAGSTSTQRQGGPTAVTKLPSTPLPYRADWSAGLNGWNGSEGWITSEGKLLSTDGADRILAPLDLTSVDNYAVEADIALVRGDFGGFGLVVRVQPDGKAYRIGHDRSAGTAFLAANNTELEARPYQPGEVSHRYRVEVRENSITVFVDGAPTLSALDNTYLSGKRVGLFCYNGAQLSVRSFAVTAL